MSRYFRVSKAFVSDERQDFVAPESLSNKLRSGDRLVLAAWDESPKRAICRWVGVVVSHDGAGGQTQVEWQRCFASLSPNPQGYQQWRKPQGWFQFHQPVAERYRLPALFSGWN